MTRSQLRRKLRTPLPPEAISDNPVTGLSSIDVNYVTERLNDCFGESGWTAKYEVIEKGSMIVVRCDLTVKRWGIVRQAFGGNSMEDRGDAYKSACSDSLKKCASQIGIANEVYKGKYLAQVSPVTPANFAPARLFNGSRYGVIDGVVQYWEPISPDAMFMIVDGHKVRVTNKSTIKALKGCRGKRVELRCKKDGALVTALDVLAMSNPKGGQA